MGAHDRDEDSARDEVSRKWPPARLGGTPSPSGALGAVLNQSYRDAMASTVAGLPPAIADRVLSSVAFTSSPAVKQFGAAGQALVDKAREAFVGGVSDAVFIGCIVLAVAAVLVFLLAGSEQVATASDAAPEADPQPA